MTQENNLAISNQTIPNQDILGPFLGLFDPVFGQKYQKVGGFDLRTHIPWMYVKGHSSDERCRESVNFLQSGRRVVDFKVLFGVCGLFHSDVSHSEIYLTSTNIIFVNF